MSVNVRRPLSECSAAVQQMTAIARALSQQARLLVMDEPTSSLDAGEIRTLFGVLRQLKGDGVSLLFVSHKLDEVYDLCDRVSVLRDGITVMDGQPLSDVSRLNLVAAMLGKDPQALEREGQTGFSPQPRMPGDPLLHAEHLTDGAGLQDVSVSVRAGEIVGLAGLLGSGRTETARACFGAGPSGGTGTITFAGRPVRFRSPADAIKTGLGFCSEDRKQDGIIPHLSVRENLTLAALPTLSCLGVVNSKRQTAIVDDFIRRLGIKTAGPEQPIRELSGGNQQKVLLARWLCLSPKLLLLDEPTRGIDVGAKAEIQKVIDGLARVGMGVLLISSETEELSEGADRVVVLRDGKSVAAFERGQATQAALLSAMAAGKKRPPRPPKFGGRKHCEPVSALHFLPEWKRSMTNPGELPPPNLLGPGGLVRWAANPALGAAAGLIALLVYNALWTRGFLTAQTAGVLLSQVSPVALVAVGMTLVIATGGIDLSVGSLMAIAGAAAPLVFAGHTAPFHTVGAGIGAALVLCGLLGLLNGVLVAALRIQPIVATLVLYIAGRGIAQVLTNGNLQTFHSAAFAWLGQGRVLGLPVPFLLMALTAGAAAWAVRRTVWGRCVLAVGGNAAAARLAGVPVQRVTASVYVLSGLLAGLAGLTAVSLNSASDAGVVGLGMELSAIVAVAVGGTPLTGGRASVLGTVVGAFLVGLIQFTLLSRNVPTAAALVVNAALIVAAVAVQRRRG